MSDIDPELKAVLAERGEGVRVGAGLADRAIARDSSNRHRELGVAALGAGLVLAVAVPLTWSAVTPTGSRPLPVGPSQSTSPPTTLPSPSPSTSTLPSTSGPTTPTSPTTIPTLRSTGAPSAAVLRPATGPATGITDVGFVVDGVYREGQRQTKLSAPFLRPDRVAALGDGLLITVGGRAVVVDAAGRTLRDLPTLLGPIAVTADRSHGLVTDQAGNLLYLDSRGKQVARLAATKGGAAGWQVAGLVGDTAYAVNTDQTSSIAWDVRSTETTTIKGAIGPIDAAGRRAIVTPGLSPGQPGYGCQRLVDLTSGRTIWNLCGPLWFSSFSPDGSHLLGQGFSDGQPPELSVGPNGKPLYQQFVVAQADNGRVVLQGGGDGSQATGSVRSARFGADGSITAQITAAGQQSDLQRCAIDGQCAVVAAAGASWQPDIPEAAGPYLLAEN